MTFHIRRKIVLALVLLASLSFLPALAGFAGNDDQTANRAKLISYLLREQLTRHHYSHKPIDDELSLAAFDLYLKQLDYQKRFLLQKDAARLRTYASRIDDEMNANRIELPFIGAEILRERVRQVQAMARKILADDFDFTVREYLETDPDKIEFCASPAELKERWRKVLKYQVLNRYLDLREEAAGDGAAEPKSTQEKTEPGPDPLLAKAREKVLKSQEHFFSRLLEEKEQDHVDRYFNAVARAFDPHTNYLPPFQNEDFDIGMRGSLEGIGAVLREEDGYIKVMRVIPGSAADRQGQLEAEDVILKVAEGDDEPADVTDARLRDAVELIRGPKGTEVRLTVKKVDGTHLVIPIVRDVVEIEETFVKGTVLEDEPGGKKIGYLKIPAFYRDFQGNGTGRNSTEDVRRELAVMTARKVDGLILDLRNNGGGALADAVSISGLFIKEGPVVQVRGSDGRAQVLADEDAGIAYDGPLVILVNQFSASASEILAGAMQDYGRAIILGGAHTHGKGTVQAKIDLDRVLPLRNMEQYKPLGALKVTIQKFYRVNGESTQYRGVVPDIVLPNRIQYLESGERYLDHSLPWDAVDPLPHASWSMVRTSLPELKAKSMRRVQADPEFVELARVAEAARERSAQTRQSLHIDDLRREREEARRWMESGHGEGARKGNDSSRKEEDSSTHWIAEVAADPAVAEARTVLKDLLPVVARGH